ncbi:MAG: hypothetical protein JWQ66_2155 [Mucilaginibacter sp.]|nr:hypothetical protein [Mucilaginibacter sp.]
MMRSVNITLYRDFGRFARYFVNIGIGWRDLPLFFNQMVACQLQQFLGVIIISGGIKLFFIQIK